MGEELVGDAVGGFDEIGKSIHSWREVLEAQRFTEMRRAWNIIANRKPARPTRSVSPYIAAGA